MARVCEWRAVHDCRDERWSHCARTRTTHESAPCARIDSARARRACAHRSSRAACDDAVDLRRDDDGVRCTAMADHPALSCFRSTWRVHAQRDWLVECFVDVRNSDRSRAHGTTRSGRTLELRDPFGTPDLARRDVLSSSVS